MDNAVERELIALELLADSDRPIGASALKRTFAGVGIEMGEATAGRFLQHLDGRGLVRSQGPKQGRIITPKGRRRLADLRLMKRQDRVGGDLLKAIQTVDLDDLIDLLLVRRAVEVEAARLAAVRATAEELATISEQAAHHLADVPVTQAITAPAMDFHRLVAEASHNRVLITVIQLLLDPTNDPLERVLEAIALDADVSVDHVADHTRLAEALASGDPASAGEAMHDHLDRLIAAVEHYRDMKANQRPGSRK